MEIREPMNAGDYQDRDIKAVFVALIELGQILKPFEKSYVIIGGSVPWLLLDQGRPPHLGTLDIDIGLNPENLDDGQYATLVETLERAGYRRDFPSSKPFQLQKLVGLHDGGVPVPVIVDLLAPKGVKLKGNKPQLVQGLRVLQVDGCGLALRSHTTKEIRGTMPDGRPNMVELPISSIPALLVMKGYALCGRDKMKDAYDIYYSVRNYPGGAAKLGEDCRPLLEDPIAAEGFRLLASKFREREDFGPATVRKLLEEAASEFRDMEPEQIQTDAFGQVSAFLRALEIPEP